MVVEEKGDYLLVVNELLVQNQKLEQCTRKEFNERRIEKRTAYTTTKMDWLQGKEKCKKLSTIGAIYTEFTKNGETSREWHYYISSRKLKPEELLKHARLEQAAESMHWLLDVHFQEDKTKVWDMNVQQNLNIMRKTALNLAREYKNRFEPRKAISGILKCNLFDVKNLVKFIAVLLR